MVGDTSTTSHVKVHDCYVHTTCREGIATSYGGNHAIEFYDNELEDCARYRGEGGSYYEVAMRLWGSSSVKAGDLHAYRNKVYETHGEAINITNADDSSAYENEIYSWRSVGIYISGWGGLGIDNITVSDNKITGTTNSSYYRTGIFDGHAISIAQEVAAATENLSNIYIYGNLISYAYTGLYCSNSATTSYDQITNVDFVNNTVIDCDRNIRLDSNATYSSFLIINNIFWCITADCDQDGDTSKPTGVTASDNMWWPSASVRYSGTGDVTENPQLSKTTGWRAATVPTGADFTLATGSGAIDRKAAARSITTLPLSGSTWPTSVTSE